MKAWHDRTFFKSPLRFSAHPKLTFRSLPLLNALPVVLLQPGDATRQYFTALRTRRWMRRVVPGRSQDRTPAARGYCTTIVTRKVRDACAQAGCALRQAGSPLAMSVVWPVRFAW